MKCGMSYATSFPFCSEKASLQIITKKENKNTVEAA
jgi:hypothetical protein